MNMCSLINFIFSHKDAVHSYSGGLDCTLKMFDFNTSTGTFKSIDLHQQNQSSFKDTNIEYLNP